MEHGRDHEQRQAHARPLRTNNTPRQDVDSTLDAEINESKHGDIVPPQGVIGAVRERPGYSETTPPAGSDTAPTERALERERERHRREEDLGHFHAGEHGLTRAASVSSVTRADLDEAARKADRHVADPTKPRT